MYVADCMVYSWWQLDSQQSSVNSLDEMNATTTWT